MNRRYQLPTTVGTPSEIGKSSTFYIRRIFRIYPLSILCVVVVTAFGIPVLVQFDFWGHFSKPYLGRRDRLGSWLFPHRDSNNLGISLVYINSGQYILRR